MRRMNLENEPVGVLIYERPSKVARNGRVSTES